MSPQAPGPGRVERVAGTLLGVGMVVLAIARLVEARFDHRIWADRELMRGAHFFDEWPTTGAELSYAVGARIPGGALYLLVALGQAIHDSPTSVQRLIYGLDTLGALAVAWVVGRSAGRLAAAATLGVWLGVAVVHEGLAQIWNPAFMPAFIALAMVGAARVATQRDPRGWIGVGLGLALAAQLHLSAIPFGGTLIALTLLARTPGSVRWSGFAALAGLATYAPYLISESRDGWLNTHMLMNQPHLSHTVPMWLHGQRWADAVQLLPALSLQQSAPWMPSWSHAAAWLTFPTFAWGLWRSARGAWAGDAGDRGLFVMIGSIVPTAAYMFADPYIATEPRYFFVFVPGLAVGCGVGLADMVRVLEARSAALAAAFVLVPIGAILSASTWWIPDQGIQERAIERYETALDQARAKSGWTWTELAGRTVIVGADTPGAWRASFGMDDMLRRHGGVFPGSLTPPCGMLLLDGQSSDEVAKAIPSTVEVGPAGFTWIENSLLAADVRWVVYDPGTPLCPTAMIERYRDLPAEVELRAVAPSLPLGAAASLPSADPATQRWAVAVPADPSGGVLPMVVGVGITRRGDALDVTLDSAQLRGESFNTGWFVPAMVDHPRLRVDRPDGTQEEVAIVDGHLGFRAASTPVAKAVSLAAGPGKLTLVLDVLHQVQGAAWPLANPKSTRFEIPLTDSVP